MYYNVKWDYYNYVLYEITISYTIYIILISSIIYHIISSLYILLYNIADNLCNILSIYTIVYIL